MIAPLLRTAITTGSLLLAPAPDATEPASEDVDAGSAERPEEDKGAEAPVSDEVEAPENALAAGDEDDQEDAASEDPAGDLGGAGVAGQLVDKDDPNASRATADLEGEALGKAGADVPARLRPLQAGAWWSLFATAGLATAGGVFAGLSERQEDEAIRVTQLVDLSTGSSYEYADIAQDYERMLDRGEQLSWAARGFFIASAATAITSITLFALDRRRQKSGRRRVSFGAGSAFLRF